MSCLKCFPKTTTSHLHHNYWEKLVPAYKNLNISPFEAQNINHKCAKNVLIKTFILIVKHGSLKCDELPMLSFLLVAPPPFFFR